MVLSGDTEGLGLRFNVPLFYRDGRSFQTIWGMKYERL